MASRFLHICCDTAPVSLRLGSGTFDTCCCQTSFGTRGRRKRREHCAARLWLPGNPAVCYRLSCSRVHLENVVSCISPAVSRDLLQAVFSHLAAVQVRSQ